MTFLSNVHNELRIEIYKFTLYDTTLDKMVLSKRWGTKDKINEIFGSRLDESKRSVDASAVKSDTPGLTIIGYAPPLY